VIAIPPIEGFSVGSETDGVVNPDQGARPESARVRSEYSGVRAQPLRFLSDPDLALSKPRAAGARFQMARIPANRAEKRKRPTAGVWASGVNQVGCLGSLQNAKTPRVERVSNHPNSHDGNIVVPHGGLRREAPLVAREPAIGTRQAARARGVPWAGRCRRSRAPRRAAAPLRAEGGVIRVIVPITEVGLPKTIYIVADVPQSFDQVFQRSPTLEAEHRRHLGLVSL